MTFKTFAGIGAFNLPKSQEFILGTILGKISHKLCLEHGWLMTCGNTESGCGYYFKKGLPSSSRKMKPFFDAESMDPDLLEKAREILIEKNIYTVTPRFVSANKQQRQHLDPREFKIAHAHYLCVFQILQEKLIDPVKMVICWTPDGAVGKKEYTAGVTGLTGIAIKLAEAYDIPVFNLQRNDHLKRVCDFIGEPIPSP